MPSHCYKRDSFATRDSAVPPPIRRAHLPIRQCRAGYSLGTEGACTCDSKPRARQTPSTRQRLRSSCSCNTRCRNLRQRESIESPRLASPPGMHHTTKRCQRCTWHRPRPVPSHALVYVWLLRRHRLSFGTFCPRIRLPRPRFENWPCYVGCCATSCSSVRPGPLRSSERAFCSCP